MGVAGAGAVLYRRQVMNGSGPSGKVLKGRDPVPRVCVCCVRSEITAPLGLPSLSEDRVYGTSGGLTGPWQARQGQKAGWSPSVPPALQFLRDPVGFEA